MLSRNLFYTSQIALFHNCSSTKCFTGNLSHGYFMLKISVSPRLYHRNYIWWKVNLYSSLPCNFTRLPVASVIHGSKLSFWNLLFLWVSKSYGMVRHVAGECLTALFTTELLHGLKHEDLDLHRHRCETLRCHLQTVVFQKYKIRPFAD